VTRWWGQGCAEPRGLTGSLLAQRESIGRFRCMIGFPTRGTSVRFERTNHVDFLSDTGSGMNEELHRFAHLNHREHLEQNSFRRLGGLRTKGSTR
jgi:hypothetical protein